MDYEKAISNINSDTWSELTPQEKLDTLQAVENELARRDSRVPVQIQAERSGLAAVNYDSMACRVYIDPKCLEPGGEDPLRLVEGISHMCRHVYQHQAVRGEIPHPDAAEVEAWRFNFDKSTSIRRQYNPKAFFYTDSEIDARKKALGDLDSVRKDVSISCRTAPEKPAENRKAPGLGKGR